MTAVISKPTKHRHPATPPYIDSCPTVRNLPAELTALMPDLERLARRLSASPDLAQDLCQDTALRLWARISQGSEIGDLGPYARSALRNGLRSHGRALRPDQRRAEGDSAPISPDMIPCPPEAFRSLACAEVRAAMERLAPEQAEVLRLIAAGESSPAALAAQLGLPKNTVMSRLARGRSALRRALDLAPDAPVTALFAEED